MLQECSFGSDRVEVTCPWSPHVTFGGKRQGCGFEFIMNCALLSLCAVRGRTCTTARKRPGGSGSLLGTRPCSAGPSVAPTLQELGSTRCTSLIYKDGTVDYVEDDDVWANGEEPSLPKLGSGQTEFLAIPLEASSSGPSGDEVVDRSALRRVRRGVRTCAANEGDATQLGEDQT